MIRRQCSEQATAVMRFQPRSRDTMRPQWAHSRAWHCFLHTFGVQLKHLGSMRWHQTAR
jgi:hypothetical protein